MNYYESQFFVPGKTYDNFVFFKCDEKFMSKAEQSLKNYVGEVPAICVEFSAMDCELLNPFFKKYTQHFQQKIIARTLVNTKIFNEVFKVIQNRDIYTSAKFLALKNQLVKGAEMFNSGDVCGFNNYYVEIPLHASMLHHILKDHHGFELNIFERKMNNAFIQTSINNYLGGRTPYSIKVFTTEDRFCINLDECGNLVESVHDYSAREPFELSGEEDGFVK